MKDFEFEKLVNNYFKVEHGLVENPNIDTSEKFLERIFVVEEIKIEKIINLRLSQDFSENHKGKIFQFKYLKIIKKYYLIIKNETEEKTFEIIEDQSKHSFSDLEFVVRYSNHSEEILIYILKLEDYLTVVKNEIDLKSDDNLLLKLEMNKMNDLIFNYDHDLFSHEKDKNVKNVKNSNATYYEFFSKNNEKNGIKPKYLITQISKKRENDGYFDIKSQKILQYLSEIKIDYDKRILEGNQNEEDLQIILNFKLENKKEFIKKVLLESKSSSNNLVKTIQQFKYHCLHLATTEEEKLSALFILYIQMDPKTISINKFNELLNTEKNVAIILIHPKNFFKLPYVQLGENAQSIALRKTDFKNDLSEISNNLSGSKSVQENLFSDFNIDKLKERKYSKSNLRNNKLALKQQKYRHNKITSKTQNDLLIGLQDQNESMQDEFIPDTQDKVIELQDKVNKLEKQILNKEIEIKNNLLIKEMEIHNLLLKEMEIKNNLLLKEMEIQMLKESAKILEKEIKDKTSVIIENEQKYKKDLKNFQLGSISFFFLIIILIYSCYLFLKIKNNN